MRYKHHTFTCTNSTGCGELGAEKVQSYLKAKLKKLGLKSEVRANKAGCLDACSHGPVTVIYPEGIWYRITTEAEADLVLEQHLLGGKPVESLMVRDLNPDYPFSKKHEAASTQ